MNADDVAEQIFALSFKAAMSQEYFQTMEWRWWVADTVAKIVVALLAILGVYTAAGKPKWLGKRGLDVAMASVLLLIIILIVPADRWAQDYRELGREWASIRQQAEILDDDLKKDGVTDSILAQLQKTKERIGLIEEPSIWRSLLVHCYWNQIERVYGEGIRSKDKLDEHLSKATAKEPMPPVLDGAIIHDQASQ